MTETCRNKVQSEHRLIVLFYSIQDVSEIHGITSGISSSYIDNKKSLYPPRPGNAQLPSF
jgi:hypothetical protein